ncbi:Phage transcriptional regulator, AlpA [metagenome]|uniref:Phage transcriptional regulator, AlpA n=1 Tax=metagenome TaxID=256318 RepID=A0A2P2C867_9ZZZZ
MIGVHLMCMKTHTNPLSGLDPLLSIDELAEYLGVSIKTIYEWRQTGRGPVGIRMGRHLKFAVSDVRAWLDEKRESQPGRPAETG